MIEVKVPDIGDFKDIPVIEVLVKPGDTVKAEDPLVTLESDKATMDVPAPSAGVVKEVKLKVGDKVSEGSLVLLLDAAGVAAAAPAAQPGPASAPAAAVPATAAPPASAPAVTPPAPAPAAAAAPSATAPAAVSVTAPVAGPIDDGAFVAAHASPSVRKFARELGVDLSRVKGTGPHARILQEDVQAFVKGALAGGAGAPGAAGSVTGGGSLNLLPWPTVDFAKFGPVETVPLSRIKKISGANLARNWVMIPHVTQFDDADITDLEALRVTLNKENEKAGVKLTMLAFLIKAASPRCASSPTSTPRSTARISSEAVLPHRLRRRHAQRPRGPGAPRTPTRRACSRSRRK
jgi:pyruvate dehydrogenase E2 component (dihydrolipoamide acetyltransferase)